LLKPHPPLRSNSSSAGDGGVFQFASIGRRWVLFVVLKVVLLLLQRNGATKCASMGAALLSVFPPFFVPKAQLRNRPTPKLKKRVCPSTVTLKMICFVATKNVRFLMGIL